MQNDNKTPTPTPTPTNNNRRADEARSALAGFHQEGEVFRFSERWIDSTARIEDLIVSLGHLCDVEDLDFVDILKKAVEHWTVEREGSEEIARPGWLVKAR